MCDISELLEKPKREYEKDVILAFSGGIDSYATYLKLLDEKQYNIHLYYYNIKNNGIKTWCEQTNSKTLINEIADKYCVKYTYNCYDSSEILLRFDTPLREYFSQKPLWIFLMGYNALSFENPYFALGYNQYDFSKDYYNRKEIMQTYIDCFWTLITDKISRSPEILFPLENMSKRQIINYLRWKEKELDIDILSKIWTCEFPVVTKEHGFVGYKPCGTCEKCMEYKENS